MTEMSSEAATENAGDTVVVSRQVSHPLTKVWSVLMTDEGASALLGPGGHLREKGHTWEAEDGTHGVTRSFHPMEQIRFSWHQGADAPATMVDLHLAPAGDDATRLELVHSKLADGVDRAALEKHWTDALQRIDDDAL